MDKITKERRSKNMSRIRSKNTKPEILIRKLLYKKGFRYRLHYNLPGKPDIVFPNQKVAIFINGCFWHDHKCKLSHTPKSNIFFWRKKILLNSNRDKTNIQALNKLGWRVETIWECSINKNINKAIDTIYNYKLINGNG